MSDLRLADGAELVAILLFDAVELLDFAGPYEALAVAGRPDGPLRIDVRGVGMRLGPVRSRCGPLLVVEHEIDELIKVPPRVLIVPGGFGVRALMDDAKLLEVIRILHARGTVIASVCTGAWVLAKAGILDGREATTHQLGIERLAELAPTCTIRASQRIVDTGDVVTSGGISAGIDLGVHLVARLTDGPTAMATATYLEWEWSGDSGWDQLSE